MTERQTEPAFGHESSFPKEAEKCQPLHATLKSHVKDKTDNIFWSEGIEQPFPSSQSRIQGEPKSISSYYVPHVPQKIRHSSQNKNLLVRYRNIISSHLLFAKYLGDVSTKYHKLIL